MPAGLGDADFVHPVKRSPPRQHDRYAVDLFSIAARSDTSMKIPTDVPLARGNAWPMSFATLSHVWYMNSTPSLPG
jgi:hypothetical protein